MRCGCRKARRMAGVRIVGGFFVRLSASRKERDPSAESQYEYNVSCKIFHIVRLPLLFMGLIQADQNFIFRAKSELSRSIF